MRNSNLNKYVRDDAESLTFSFDRKGRDHLRRLVLLLTFALGVSPQTSFAQPAAPANPSLPETPASQAIDLATTLRLAHAQNLDIQIARQKLIEAKASHDAALLQFFPWLSPGISFRRHDNLIQDVGGSVVEVHKQSYAPGATFGAQLDIGDALYNSLAAKQEVSAADASFKAQQQDSATAASSAYFDLAFAEGAMLVAEEAVAISTNYQAQIERAVGAGIAFRGDALRVKVQTERNSVLLAQALEQKRVASSRLAQLLHLDPAINLSAQSGELVPLLLIETNRPLDALWAEAQTRRPELRRSTAESAAALARRKQAVYGPLIPSVGAQAFFGGLGGGFDGGPSRFGEQEDYGIGIGWRIGPGGLFDQPRKRQAESRLAASQLTELKVQDEVKREVVDAFTHVQSIANQMQSAERAVAAAQTAFELSQQRKEFGVGIVLETIQSEQDLTRARLDYLRTVSDFDKAQFALQKAVGGEIATAQNNKQ